MKTWLIAVACIFGLAFNSAMETNPPRFIVGPIVANDYASSAGELVRVDMTGRSSETAPVVITLPGPTAENIGCPIKVITVNSGGAEDNSLLRIETQNGAFLPSNLTYMQNIGGGEQFWEFVSDGENWVVTGM